MNGAVIDSIVWAVALVLIVALVCLTVIKYGKSG